MGRVAFHVDHIISRNEAPNLINELSNLTWSCIRCNMAKGRFTHGHIHGQSVEIPLFHPITERWASHFSGISNGKINGMTQVGRATESRLRFNEEATVVAARADCFEEGWWPG